MVIFFDAFFWQPFCFWATTMQSSSIEITYSCFEKGCLTKGEKLTRQCRKLLWVMVAFAVA